jgi:hypothetical protein
MEPDAMDEWGGAPNLHVHGRLSRVMIVAEVGGVGLVSRSVSVKDTCNLVMDITNLGAPSDLSVSSSGCF